MSAHAPPDPALQQLGELSAELAHELHNLLLTIALSAHAAQRAPEQAEPHWLRVQHTVTLAQALVQDVLALAKPGPLPLAPLEWTALLAAARETLQHPPERFVDELEAGPAPQLHPRLMSRALHALYTNSIEAARRAGCSVHLLTRARRVDAQWQLDVIDDGPGLPEALRDAWMLPGKSGHAGGHGLGLALARRIAAAHGGDLALLPSDRGAAFRFTLPTPLISPPIA